MGVLRLALFGSVLRGEARPDSDADVLVEFAPGAKSFDRFLALAELLEERLGLLDDTVYLRAKEDHVCIWVDRIRRYG